MKIAQFALVAGLAAAPAAAASLRKTSKDSAADAAKVTPARQLQKEGCWGTSGTVATNWHPVYSAGWTNGYCAETNDHDIACNSPAYASELACCQGAYAGQVSGFCFSQLPAAPTTSPTDDGSGKWWPDYGMAWNVGECKNGAPVGFNRGDRPEYDTELACCKAAYGGQTSGACLGSLPAAPTTSPTDTGADEWWPDYSMAWSEGECKNGPPVGFNRGDRPTYESELACCKAAYGGQMSGACFASLPAAPTGSPTEAGGDEWWPDYSLAWSQGECKNGPPVGFNRGDRPVYESELACCKAAYGGQQSGACLGSLPEAPTTSPTEAGGLATFYPDYTKAWSVGVCTNARPLPSGRPEYQTAEACCSGAYAGQGNQWGSNECMCALDVCYSCKCSGDQSGCGGTFTVEHPTSACPA